MSDFCTLCGNLYHSARKTRSNRVISLLRCLFGVKCCFAFRISHPQKQKTELLPPLCCCRCCWKRKFFFRALSNKSNNKKKMRNEFFLLLSFVGFPFSFSLFLWFFWLFLGFGWVFLGFLKRCKVLIFNYIGISFSSCPLSSVSVIEACKVRSAYAFASLFRSAAVFLLSNSFCWQSHA